MRAQMVRDKLRKNVGEDVVFSPERREHEQFRQFSPNAQRAIQLARQEASRFNHQYVGTEHLLLGILALGEGVAVTVLSR